MQNNRSTPAAARPTPTPPGLEGVHAWEAEGGACPGVEAPHALTHADQVRAITDEYSAAEIVPQLGWSRAMAEALNAARDGLLHINDAGQYRRKRHHAPSTAPGRPVRAERVRLLLQAGYLRAETDRRGQARLWPTADGHRALTLALLNPAALHADDRAAQRARHQAARRSRHISSDERKARARTLPPLPRGQEEERRRAAWWEKVKMWEQQSADRRRENERRMRQAEQEQEQRASEQRAERQRLARERAEKEEAAWARRAVDTGWRVQRLGRLRREYIIDGHWQVSYRGARYDVSRELGALWVIAGDNSRLGTVPADTDGAPDLRHLKLLLDTSTHHERPDGRASTSAEPVPQSRQSPDSLEPPPGDCASTAVAPGDVRHTGRAARAAGKRDELLSVSEVDALAAEAHAGQVDKIGVPYISHVRAVAAGLAPFGDDLTMAGLLHDIVEDTDWTAERLREAGIPAHVVDLVEAVTNVPGMPYEEKIARITANPHATLVKIADNETADGAGRSGAFSATHHRPPAPVTISAGLHETWERTTPTSAIAQRARVAGRLSRGVPRPGPTTWP